MESFRAKGKETEKLHQRFKKLEREWQALKESKPTHKHSSPSYETIQKPHKYSPRELMFNLQQESPSPAEAWENVTRSTNDMVVQEILQERREAIERGKLKGRRLFQSDVEGECSSHEVRSMSFYNSEDESSGSQRVHDYSTRELSYSSSSSSCLAGGDNDKDMEVVANLVAMKTDMRVASIGRRGNGRTRYAVFLGGIAIILLVIASCIRLTRDDCNVILVPT